MWLEANDGSSDHLTSAHIAPADTVELKDGRVFEGKVTKQDSKSVKIKTSFGELEFPRKDVVKITKGKTPEEEFEDRKAKAKTAQEFYELGLWAKKKKLRKKAKQCMRRAIEIDPKHAEANKYLGHVEYKGEWMTPEEREKRMAQDADADMLAKGLVQYEGRWVTPEEKRNLEKGLVLYEGRWMRFAEAQRARGLAEFEGTWIPKAEAKARGRAKSVEEKAGVKFESYASAEGLVLAPPGLSEEIKLVGDSLLIGRKWFNDKYATEPGLKLFKGLLPEFYMFQRDAKGYTESLDHFASRGKYLPDSWATLVRELEGFYWWDPHPTSNARQGARDVESMVGQCYHHHGHILANSLSYGGTLLPPWYDEGIASLIEFFTHGRNAVFCHAHEVVRGGTVASTAEFEFDPKSMRDGRWREVVKLALEKNRVRNFDKLAQLEFSQLTMLDIAISMAIVEWMSQAKKDALPAFHKVLRDTQPKPPMRVIERSHERFAQYDAAFRAAVGMDWRAADKAWRKWLSGQ